MTVPGYDYYAVRLLYIGGIPAFTTGALVPDTTAASQGWIASGDVLPIGTPPPTSRVLVSGAQTLTTGEQAQVCTNIGAGSLAGDNEWTAPTANVFRSVLKLRANDAAIGAPTAAAAPILLKPPTDLTAGVWQGYHSAASGFLVHFTGDGGANTTSASGLIGLGPSGPETGLVIDNFGVGRALGLTNEAGSTGPGVTASNFGTGTLFEINSGGAATGHLMTFTVPGTMPAASRVLSAGASTGANPEAIWIGNDLSLHMSAAGVLHQTDYNLGAGFNQMSYVWAAGTTYWAHAVDMTGPDMKIRQATGVANKGSETLNTLLQFQNGNAIAFFASTPVAKQTAHAIAAGNYVAGTGTAVTIDGSFSGANGGTCYTVGDIVGALKAYGLLVL